MLFKKVMFLQAKKFCIQRCAIIGLALVLLTSLCSVGFAADDSIGLLMGDPNNVNNEQQEMVVGEAAIDNDTASEDTVSESVVITENSGVSSGLLKNFIIIPAKWIDGVVTEVFAILIPIKGAEAAKVGVAYDAGDVMKDVMDAIKGSNDNIRKNKDVYLDGLNAARKGKKKQEEIITAFEQNPDMQDLLRQTKELMCDLNGDCPINEDGLTLEQQQKIHNAAVRLADEKLTYDKMQCNKAVSRIFKDAGLYYIEETVFEFPKANVKYFQELFNQSQANLQTGDVGVWKRGKPDEELWIHHMLIYDKNASGISDNGKPNDAWSTHTRSKGRLFTSTRVEIFSNSFGFLPKWFRYKRSDQDVPH